MQNPSSANRHKILFICHDGKIYGAQKSLKLLVENLPREKYQVFVSFSRPGPLVEALNTLPDVTVLFHQRIQGVKHSQRNPLQRLGDLLGTLLNLPRAFSLARTLRKHRIDLVHTNSIVSFEGALAARIAGIPHVWHIREPFGEYNPRFHLILGIKLTRWLVQTFSNRVLCISRYVYEQCRPYTKKTPEKYHVLYNALPSDEITIQNGKTQEVSNMLRLVYTGRISDGKRFQDVLDAFCLLKKRWPDPMPFSLDVYGDFICPHFERMVRTRIDTENLGPVFRLRGYQNDINTCYQDIDLLVMPSSTEAFGRTLLDSLIRGIPAIAPRSGAAVEILEEDKSGFFYHPNDPQDLAQCLERIYANRAVLPTMHQACVQRVHEQFNVPRQIQALDTLYQEILKAR